MKTNTFITVLAFLGTLIYLFLLLPVFLILIPYKILLLSGPTYHFDIGATRYLGLIPIGLGVAIFSWCSYSFVFSGKGTPIPFTPTKRLVVTGLFRFVRNPLYIAGILVLTGEALFFQSGGIFIYCLVMFGIFNMHVFMEESLLEEKFGATYQRYLESVPRWIPRLTAYRENDSENRCTK